MFGNGFLRGEFSARWLTLVENSFIIFNSRRGGEIGIRARLNNQARFAFPVERCGNAPDLIYLVYARVAEWQTRRTQNPLPARACGFKSLLWYLMLVYSFLQM